MKIYSAWDGKNLNKFELVLNSLEFVNNYLTVEKFAADIEQTIGNTSNFLSYYRNGVQTLEDSDYIDLINLIDVTAFNRWLEQYHLEQAPRYAGKGRYKWTLQHKRRLVEYAIKEKIIKPLRFDFNLLSWV